jgi:hypothetical protein
MSAIGSFAVKRELNDIQPIKQNHYEKPSLKKSKGHPPTFCERNILERSGSEKKI